MSKKPRSLNMNHRRGHFLNRLPHNSTRPFSETLAKNKLVCSKLSPSGELQEMHLTALWWTLSEYDALVNKVFFRVVCIMKSFPSGTAQHFSNPSSLYCCGQVNSKYSGSMSRIESAFPAYPMLSAAEFINRLQWLWCLPMTKEIVVTVMPMWILRYANKYSSNGVI